MGVESCIARSTNLGSEAMAEAVTYRRDGMIRIAAKMRGLFFLSFEVFNSLIDTIHCRGSRKTDVLLFGC